MIDRTNSNLANIMQYTKLQDEYYSYLEKGCRKRCARDNPER